ncbi:hypothetical protein GJ496_000072 [Pomphorhynchus laevis]|nr:hypothetical protein GJ496_000072 [Pomphorhynchus laevis]
MSYCIENLYGRRYYDCIINSRKNCFSTDCFKSVTPLSGCCPIYTLKKSEGCALTPLSICSSPYVSSNCDRSYLSAYCCRPCRPRRPFYPCYLPSRIGYECCDGSLVSYRANCPFKPARNCCKTVDYCIYNY